MLSVVFYYLITFLIAAALMPLVIKAGIYFDVVAKMNKRTVHTVEIPRIGGYAVYVAFLLGALIFLKTDTQVNSILLGGFIIFMVGLYDDVHDISPRLKLLGQLVAAVIVIVFGGVYLQNFGESIPFLAEIVTLFWIVGITNAINLIDGLDGLSGGISVIVLFTISLTSYLSGRVDIASLSLVLAGAISGFLLYNFHPAKVFMGDCGALFIGFMISSISLLGFGYNTSTFFTLGAPIVVLMVPIMDTLIAIVRRKVRHKKFNEADKRHIHHRLMYKFDLGHKRTVIVLYTVTLIFSFISILYYYNPLLGLVFFLIMLFVTELFVEMSNMISRHYKPILTIANIFLNREDLPKLRVVQKVRRSRRYKITVGLCVIGVLGILIYNFRGYLDFEKESLEEIVSPYVALENQTDLLDELYSDLNKAYEKDQKETEYKLLAAYFVSDLLTTNNNIGESNGYLHPSIEEEFIEYIGKNFGFLVQEYDGLEVKGYEIISASPTSVSYEGIDSTKYYQVTLNLTLNQIVTEIATTTVIVTYEDDRYYVVGIELLRAEFQDEMREN